jgi:hypothetical protein
VFGKASVSGQRLVLGVCEDLQLVAVNEEELLVAVLQHGGLCDILERKIVCQRLLEVEHVVVVISDDVTHFDVILKAGDDRYGFFHLNQGFCEVSPPEVDEVSQYDEMAALAEVLIFCVAQKIGDSRSSVSTFSSFDLSARWTSDTTTIATISPTTYRSIKYLTYSQAVPAGDRS